MLDPWLTFSTSKDRSGSATVLEKRTQLESQNIDFHVVSPTDSPIWHPELVQYLSYSKKATQHLAYTLGSQIWKYLLLILRPQPRHDIDNSTCNQTLLGLRNLTWRIKRLKDNAVQPWQQTKLSETVFRLFSICCL